MQWKSIPPLEFEINDKTYSVTPIGEREYGEYLDWQAILSGKKEAPAPEDEGQMLLGEAYDQMVADKAPAEAIRRAMLTVFTDLRLDRETAERVWESGLDPEALAPKTGAASTSTGEATTTPTPASTSGTTSPRANSRAKGKRASK